MTQIDDLLGRVRSVATEVRNAVRTEPTNNELAGWGQFIEPSSQVFQIGPYGTSAGIMLAQIENADAPVDKRVKAQLHEFWNEKPAGKLFPQNVRLAFVVLALARSIDTDLIALRDEIATELRKRQSSDGSWSDATPHVGAPTGGQNDATAWVALALYRADPSDEAAHRAAKWLAKRVEGTGSVPILSSISLAVALFAHPNPLTLPHIRNRAFEVLKSRRLAGELISFFDYEELTKAGDSVQKRDYLCFPAFFIEAVLLNGLSKGAGLLERQRLTIYSTEIVDKMIALTGGPPYKMPGTRFTSTVDQAFYALGYENISEAQANIGSRTSRIAPLYATARRSVIINLILPFVALVAALLTIEDASSVPVFLKGFFGDGVAPLVAFATAYPFVMKLIAAVVIAFLPSIPRRGWAVLKEKLWRA
ncbi:MAG: hypothetical protein EOS21_03155 [Mesorhizobium sp.]|nr:MAG: hypothetical protein EOS21_03155 [Mesorhizobium sp.]